jgi:hypothetical protein
MTVGILVFHAFLAKDSVQDMIELVYQAGGDGVLLWGHPDAFDHTAKDHFLTSGYQRYIEKTLGPVMAEFTSANRGKVCAVPPPPTS